MSQRSGAARRASDAYPGLRVSDAERAEVADQLSKHYGEGRLSQAEFDERLDRAMRATTRSDLSGLLDDLPGGAAEQAERRRPGRLRTLILGPVLVVLIIITAAHALAWTFHLLPWLLIGLLAFLWLRRGPRHRRI